MPISRRKLLKVLGEGLYVLGTWPKSLVRGQETVMDEQAAGASFSESLVRIAGTSPRTRSCRRSRSSGPFAYCLQVRAARLPVTFARSLGRPPYKRTR